MIKIFYNDKQSVEQNESESPSAGKPRLVVERFLRDYKDKVEVVDTFESLTKEDFYRVHSCQHVDDVLGCIKPNGFNNKLKAVAESLPWVHGSFYGAAKEAYESGGVTMSPTSGFHHAGFTTCEGFCTFNGLIVAVKKLQIESPRIKEIGIIDFDCHYGNGTVELIKKHKLGSYIQHNTFGGYVHGDKTAGQMFVTKQWLPNLEKNLEWQFQDSDLLFYQAGADPHVDDPYGGYVTTEQLKERDRIVFTVAKKLGKPLVWNLAGGYQKPIEKVLSLHETTLKEYISVYEP